MTPPDEPTQTVVVNPPPPEPAAPTSPVQVIVNQPEPPAPEQQDWDRMEAMVRKCVREELQEVKEMVEQIDSAPASSAASTSGTPTEPAVDSSVTPSGQEPAAAGVQATVATVSVPAEPAAVPPASATQEHKPTLLSRVLHGR